MKSITSSSFTLYGNSNSGNCLKPKWLCDFHAIPYIWREVDLATAETRSDAFLVLNPTGQVPLAVWEDGRTLTQSNAILLYLAEKIGSEFLPKDAFARAKMQAWLFWEQYSHEPYIAVRRSQLHVLGKSESELDPKLLKNGNRALLRMEAALANTPYLDSATMSLADIALLAYTRWAYQGGFDMANYPKIVAWIARCEAALQVK